MGGRLMAKKPKGASVEELLAELRSRGVVFTEGPPVAVPAPGRAKATKEKPAWVRPAFMPPATWVIPIATVSETNERKWRERSRRTQAARAAVSKALGPHLRHLAPVAEAYHAGREVRVLFTRLGGHRLDKSNLPAAFKATEDALALMMGASDGAKNWLPDWEQVPGGPCGVRIELSVG